MGQALLSQNAIPKALGRARLAGLASLTSRLRLRNITFTKIVRRPDLSARPFALAEQ